ncbi:alpha/beta hydrolase family protein [Bythopirellula polymerisocia]|uniref:Prolyl tripeptidyl peptidase n=1 Tax=Bythopirellula polymerisocia TaxID=2528003 RepID=A0A5C6CMC4_9BACT|nr:S9 family peptidase [Bythopirellula polymerisocia]TWU24717.1 Prolyl tripeptidyl peptidase precursor [Bythopirellula polymerisocia]
MKRFLTIIPTLNPRVALLGALIPAILVSYATLSPAASAEESATESSKPTTSTSTEEPILIPRSVLFGNPQRAGARVSPNGKWLSYLAPVDGILNVWVAPIDDLEKAKPVTKDKVRDIRGHYWAYTGDHIIYSQDKAGDENWHIYVTDVASGETKDLTPLDNIHAQVQDVSQKFPTEILVGLNDRIPQLHDIYRVNILTGDRELVQQNEGVAAYVTDDDFDVRFAFNYTPEGGTVLMKPKVAGNTGEGAEWEEFIATGPEDAMNTGPAGFDKSGNVLYLQDSRDRDTGALFAINLESGDKKLVAEDPRADVGSMIVHPTEKTIQAVSFNYTRDEWKILDEAIRADLNYLETVEDGEVIMTSRTLDDKYWTVAFMLDDGPIKFYLYDRANKKARFLFNSRDDLDRYQFSKMHTPVIKSRDGMNLVSYLTLPPGSDPDGDGVPDKPLPLVLDVHGGPWARDEWGFNSSHQWLANRGYAVLSVNYRGSTGFGKNFTNAANGEWSRKMHDDLIDAVNWAVDEGIANRDKVAIMGGSYGGYATLVGLTYTPDVFACGVDIVGPSSLVTLLENIPPYWVPFMPVMKVRVGDVDTEEGKAELLERSPLTLVDKIERPLLIGQGANDPRVTQIEADQIVEAMQAKNIPVTYVLYPDEGHGFAGEQNRMSFNAVTEAFLAEHLGGEFEPVGKDFEDSSIHVPVGAKDVSGVAEALAAERLKMPPKEEKAAAAAE